MKSKIKAAPPPLILPWLAKRAGLSETRARELWSDAWTDAVLACGNSTTPEFFRTVQDRLRALISAESRTLDRRNALRPWARLQRKVLSLQLSWIEAGAAIATGAWQRNLRPLQGSNCCCS